MKFWSLRCTVTDGLSLDTIEENLIVIIGHMEIKDKIMQMKVQSGV